LLGKNEGELRRTTSGGLEQAKRDKTRNNPLSYLVNLSKNQGGSPPVGMMAMAKNITTYATNTATA